MLKPLTTEEQAAALRTFAAEAIRLRDMAKRANADMLAFLCEQLVHEARAELAARDISPEPEPPEGENIVKLPPR